MATYRGVILRNNHQQRGGLGNCSDSGCCLARRPRPPRYRLRLSSYVARGGGRRNRNCSRFCDRIICHYSLCQSGRSFLLSGRRISLSFSSSRSCICSSAPLLLRPDCTRRDLADKHRHVVWSDVVSAMVLDNRRLNAKWPNARTLLLGQLFCLWPDRCRA